MAELDNALRSGDTWVTGSRKFRDFDDYRLGGTGYAAMKNAGDPPPCHNQGREKYPQGQRALPSERLGQVTVLTKVRDGETDLGVVGFLVPAGISTLLVRNETLMTASPGDHALADRPAPRIQGSSRNSSRSTGILRYTTRLFSIAALGRLNGWTVRRFSVALPPKRPASCREGNFYVLASQAANA